MRLRHLDWLVCCSQRSYRQLTAFFVGITLFSPIEYYAVTIGRYELGVFEIG